MFVAGIPPIPATQYFEIIHSLDQRGRLRISHRYSSRSRDQQVETNRSITASGSPLDKERYLASEAPQQGSATAFSIGEGKENSRCGSRMALNVNCARIAARAEAACFCASLASTDFAH